MGFRCRHRLRCMRKPALTPHKQNNQYIHTYENIWSALEFLRSDFYSLFGYRSEKMNFKAGGWSRKQTLKLIEELKPRMLLYKVTHPEYLKTYKKQEAFEEIAGALQNVKPNVTADNVKKKIKILQQQIATEKIRAATRSGMSADDVYISRLWCFNELNFLVNVNDEIRGESNLELNRLDDTLSEHDSRHSSEKAKRSRLDQAAVLRQSAMEAMDLATKLMQQRSAPESKEDIFCKMLSTELKQLHLTETYDNVTTELLLMVRRAKADERARYPCISGQTSLQSLALQSSSVSSLDEYDGASVHNSTMVLETSDCIENLEGNWQPLATSSPSSQGTVKLNKRKYQ